MHILYIPNDCSATGQVPFLVWGGVRAMTGELQPRICLQKPIAFSFIDFWDFPLLILGMALVACIVRPHYLSHTWTTERMCYMV